MQLEPSAVLFFLRSERVEFLEKDKELLDRLLSYVLDEGETIYHYQRGFGRGSPERRLILYLSALSSPYPWYDADKGEQKIPLRRLVERAPFSIPELEAQTNDLPLEHGEDVNIERLLNSFEVILASPLLKGNVEPWSTLLEDARKLWGERWAL
jgi:hypothetical protein